MKFKNKIIISFCIIIFVPIFLSVLTIFSVQKIQMKAIERTYGIVDDNYNYLSNTTQLFYRFTKGSFEDLKKVAKENPEKFEDTTYLEDTNAELEKKSSYLVVRKDSALVYIGKDGGSSLLTQLPPYGDNTDNAYSGTYIDGEEQALLKQVDFVYPDESKGSAFIVTVLESSVPELKKMAVDIMIAVLLILVLTACMLTIWIYTSMINPIKKLQAAAQNIKEGNLDFTVEVENDDEIGELCRSFEEMRQRLKDNTEEKIESERENKTLISNIAHDLKTPITAVKGYAEGLMDGVADTPEKRDKYIRTIYNKANEMDTLINELTLYSKIDTNRIPYNFAKINVSDYFMDCVEELGLDLEAKNIGLGYFNYVDEDVQIIADPEQLRRVINNIVGNSIKYLDKQKGFINIRIKDVGDFIQVEIEDNGRGISARDLPYIFDRFYRADASRNSATGGSGIGLSIVKKIIEDHGGKIWATSKETIGTVMYFVIRKYQEVYNEQSIDN
ncbi:MAG: HAMP domain-containing sensor histidine kinase [Clostridiales bacterium]|nr:HAMP domain-containing sensor histidine kinase [Clostridiales bacterium]